MRAWGITDIGLQRHENQDTFAIERGVTEGQLIAVVCDGMGGANCGKIASSIAVRAFTEELRAVLREDMTEQQLREAMSFCVSKANSAIRAYVSEHPESDGMGTTLVSAVNLGSTVIICNIGDSRAYRIGSDSIERITRDHSVVEGLVESGNITEEQARTHPNRNLITRALGPEEQAVADLYTVTLEKEQSILLCSDGLVVTVKKEEMLDAVAHGETPEQSLETLLTLSGKRGAPDNITAVLLCDF